MTDDEIALWLITKGTMEDKPVMSLAADRILTLRAEGGIDEWRDAVRNRIEDLIKQRDLYAEALDAISVATPGDDPARVLSECVRIAQVALGERP